MEGTLEDLLIVLLGVFTVRAVWKGFWSFNGRK